MSGKQTIGKNCILTSTRRTNCRILFIYYILITWCYDNLKFFNKFTKDDHVTNVNNKINFFEI